MFRRSSLHILALVFGLLTDCACLRAVAPMGPGFNSPDPDWTSFGLRGCIYRFLKFPVVGSVLDYESPSPANGRQANVLRELAELDNGALEDPLVRDARALSRINLLRDVVGGTTRALLVKYLGKRRNTDESDLLFAVRANRELQSVARFHAMVRSMVEKKEFPALRDLAERHSVHRLAVPLPLDGRFVPAEVSDEILEGRVRSVLSDSNLPQVYRDVLVAYFEDCLVNALPLAWEFVCLVGELDQHFFAGARFVNPLMPYRY